MATPAPASYTGTAIALHWLVALLLLGQYAFGLALDDIPRGTPARGYYVNLHKSVGILIGLLILLRIGWRLAHKPPPLPAGMAPWQRRAAWFSHAALYACMLALPLSGYLASNVSRHGIKFFNTLRWAPWGPDDKALYAFFNGAHHLAALLLALLVGLHLLAVAKHSFVDRDRLLLRMWPRRGARAEPSPSDLPMETR
ncbi:cytochrome b [Massilia sp.]|uniref:cytochrome b n=1 Tax=Massilia sp. TaxID=1882437 RepID=UPI0028ABF420|nr:cytochrome b/b6 domain-containing protein [Massilia sp.]